MQTRTKLLQTEVVDGWTWWGPMVGQTSQPSTATCLRGSDSWQSVTTHPT